MATTGNQTASLEALRFSLADTTGLHASEMTPMHRWLVQNPGSWRVSQSALVGDERRSAPGVLLLTGEAGCGKTTLMAEEADLFRDSAANLVVHVNFMDADRIDEDTRSEDLMPRLGQFLTAQIEANILKYDRKFGTKLIDDYYASRSREIVQSQQGGFLTQIKRQYGSAIDNMSNVAILTDPLIVAAVEFHSNQRQEMLLGLKSVQRIKQVDRIILLLDNLDDIGGSHAHRCLDKILNARKGKSLFYCAIRSENEYAATAKLSQHFTERIMVSAPPLSKIIDVRLKGLQEYYKSIPLKPPRGTESFRRSTTKVLRNLEASPDSISLLRQWHNSNIRSMLAFVTSSRTTLASAVTAVDMPGLMLNALIHDVDKHNDFLLAMLDGRENSRAGTSFLFLKLRILAYLVKHFGKAASRDLFKVFDSYGIRKDVVIAALSKLRQPTSVMGAFVRQARDEKGREIVSLLPAGDLFITRVAYSPEYLGYQEAKRGVATPASPASFVLAAVQQVTKRVLPAFRTEHPYIADAHVPSGAEQARLRCYRDDFGYDIDNWFISGIKRALVEYALDNQLITDRVHLTASGMLDATSILAVQGLQKCVAEISEMERQLNAVLNARVSA